MQTECLKTRILYTLLGTKKISLFTISSYVETASYNELGLSSCVNWIMPNSEDEVLDGCHIAKTYQYNPKQLCVRKEIS